MPRDSALDAAVTTRKILKEILLREYPSLAEDFETLNDSLAGLDSFEEECVAALRNIIEREAHGKALGGLIDDMQARKKRLEEGAKFLRGAILNAMQEVGVGKIRAPDMSLSIGYGKPKVVIVDEALIPDALCRISRAANKTEIAKVIAAGEAVPGTELGNPQPFLSVHRS